LTKYLVDVNVLIALADEEHIHYTTATNWLDAMGDNEWGACAFSHAGFLRIMTNPKLGGYSVGDATEVLISLSQHPGYRFWPIHDDWMSLTGPFRQRVFGHQQITDVWLLGLAVKEGGVLVTMDTAIKYLAGTRYSNHVLVLE
jgi:toxin-antitoxin system PIN domain toxin